MHLEKILRPDAKGRVCLGNITKGISGYKAKVDESTNEIILSPYVEIPAREEWLYKNKEALNSVMRGIEDSKAGRLVSRPDITDV